MKYSKLTNIALIGSGGHARSSINLLLSFFPIQNINIFDDSFEDGSKELINSIPLVGLTNAIKPEQKIFLSVGDNYLRRQYFSKYRDQILKDNICHNNSFLEQNIKMGSLKACLHVSSAAGVVFPSGGEGSLREGSKETA